MHTQGVAYPCKWAPQPRAPGLATHDLGPGPVRKGVSSTAAIPSSSCLLESHGQDLPPGLLIQLQPLGSTQGNPCPCTGVSLRLTPATSVTVSFSGSPPSHPWPQCWSFQRLSRILLGLQKPDHHGLAPETVTQ